MSRSPSSTAYMSVAGAVDGLGRRGFTGGLRVDPALGAVLERIEIQRK